MGDESFVSLSAISCNCGYPYLEWFYYPCYCTIYRRGSRNSTEAGSGRFTWFVIKFAAINQLGAEQTTEKFCSKATAAKREGMATEQFLQMPAVHTDRFSITGFATFTAQLTVIKQNFQKTESKQVICVGV